MSQSDSFPLDRRDLETLQSIERRFRSARLGNLLFALLPFTNLSGSLIGTVLSISTFEWSGWAATVRSRVFDRLACRAARQDAQFRHLELEFPAGKASDPHLRARRAFWQRMSETLDRC